MRQEGILFYNTGSKCLPRLLVAVHSLRKHYKGPICILSSGSFSRNICRSIGIKYDCIFIDMSSDIEDMKRHYLLEKTRMHKYTPFYNTIFVDSDTVTIKDPSDLFSVVNKHHFVVPQFANWTTKHVKIKKRLMAWNNIDKELVDKTLSKEYPSVNVGVYGFTKDSDFMKNWFDFAIKNPKAPIPDESSCHLLLNRYNGIVVDSKYNCSCQYDDPRKDDVRIIHYHGRKHCRRYKNGTYKYNGDYWISVWKEILSHNYCNVASWFRGCGDKYLRRWKDD